MAQWYHFYHEEEDAEIKVGLYDQWLCRLDFGPTQAERFLVHTEMMEMAHERRFVVAQGCADMSGFEMEHSLRITTTIEHLERIFINRPYDGCDPLELEAGIELDSKGVDAEEGKENRACALIGLMRGSTDGVSREGDDIYLDDVRGAFMPTLSHSLQLLSEMSALDARYKREARAAIDVDDNNSDGSREEQQHRAAIEDLARKRMRRAVDSPRRIKEVRLRKEPKLQHSNRKGNASRPSKMALDTMLN